MKNASLFMLSWAKAVTVCKIDQEIVINQMSDLHFDLFGLHLKKKKENICHAVQQTLKKTRFLVAK